MESSGSHRSGWLTAGGVLSIVGGAFEVIGAGMAAAVVVSAFIGSSVAPFHCMPSIRGVWPEYVIRAAPIWLCVVAFGVVLGVVAIVGGVSAMRRKRFGLSLAGAICALPSGILGILAIVFVAPSKGEFGAERKENGL